MAAGCGKAEELEKLADQNQELKEEIRALKAQIEEAKRLSALGDRMKELSARIVTNRGDIELTFFPDKAPIHCFNFLVRAESGYYDRSRFHRVIPGFMIQGGDPNSKDENPYNDGQGGPIFNIPHEFNEVSHRRGVLSMARQSDVSVGAGSQFFIMHGDNPGLDRQYTAFGEVTRGMEVVDRIATTPTEKADPRLRDQPVDPVVIERVEVSRQE
jgi:peptidyl-prolyl cis-trans isomerase B (cyclophilin B)